jgi:pimeloyl-ACP methyl ester carboxylesterase
MKTTKLCFAVCACVIATAGAQTQGPQHGGNPFSHARLGPAAPQYEQQFQAAIAMLPPTVSPAVVQVGCPPEAMALDPAVFCGYLPVPLDRRHPNGAKISIYFEDYLHTDPGPAESAILFNSGGPGAGTTYLRGGWIGIFQGNLDKHDLLLIDDRGRGLSGTINCPGLQSIADLQLINANNVAEWDPATGECAEQLGGAASHYASGDIAYDVDDVRAALGYDKVDYLGVSYGGLDVTAYATRFGNHLRSVVLDAPIGTPRLGPLVGEHYKAQAQPRMIRLLCQRSPICSADHPDPDAELERLIRSVRRRPVEGDAYDALGIVKHVRIDETVLLSYLIYSVMGNYTNTGELLAAGAALEAGDPAPLLRLGAESSYQLFSSVPPEQHSDGAERASICIDTDQPWNWSATPSMRQWQFVDAVEDLPRDYFSPFSKEAATSLLFSFYSRRCLHWERPSPPIPVAPPHAAYPDVPTLVLTGDIDGSVPLEETTRVAALFPNSMFVKLVGVGHAGIEWSLCARKLESNFLEDLDPGDTSCANQPEVIFPGVGRFPLKAQHARPAEVNPNGQNQIAVAERKVVSVAVATAIDALQRSTIGFGDGFGLRAGSFHTDYPPTGGQLTTLTNCAFGTDVKVSGTVFWNWATDNSVVADLTVSGTGTSGGTLHIEGGWILPPPVGNFKITGTLGGKQVAVLVPEA